MRAYLVSRYGDFILLKPPFKPETLLLWLSPALTLSVGVAAALFARRRAPHATPALSEEEEERLATSMGTAVWRKLIEAVRRPDPMMRRLCAGHEEN